MEESFQAHWSRMSTPPVSGQRYMVTDGDVIVLATYIEDNKGNMWIFSGLNESDSKTFDVQGWMPLPKPIKKIVTHENTAGEDKTAS